MANITYTVVEGDTLTEIANKYGTTADAIAKLNNIENTNLIYVGQVLIISGTGVTPTKGSGYTPKIQHFGLQSDTDRTLFATWTFGPGNHNPSDFKCFEVMWRYKTADGIWLIGDNSEIQLRESTYDAPGNAKYVDFKVRGLPNNPRAWLGSWSTVKTYNFDNNNPLVVPPVPTVELEGYQLRMSLENLDVNATHIQFKIVEIIENDNGTTTENRLHYKTVRITTDTHSVSYIYTLSVGQTVKVACRSKKGDVHSDWSDYSSEYSTPPPPPKRITECRASSETSVYLEWTKRKAAKTYDIEYTTKEEYFGGSDQTTVITDIESNHYEKTGLETGERYFFRVRSVNDAGNSTWTDPVSVPVGSKPESPTTWSSTTTAVIGETVTLFWVHNCEDGSDQTHAEIELLIDNTTTVTITKDTETSHSLDISDSRLYPDGANFKWRVRTSGVTNEYGDWSIQRVVDIYALPSLSINVTDAKNQSIEDEINGFPFYVHAVALPENQTPIGYYLNVISTEQYETLDEIGNVKIVNKGDAVYSKYFDISTELLAEFSANNIDLENNITYRIVCGVTMDSGLNAECELEFIVAWNEVYYEPNASVYVDSDSLVAYISPFIEDENGNKIKDAILSVYRREYNGTFTEICKEIPNNITSYVTDPHPSLDYARYRIVAKDRKTGAISYYDLPGYPVEEKSIVIQWAETWTSFDIDPDEIEILADPPWSGSMLKFPYNVDVSENYNPDVSLIEYVGREHPVSYYGTQRGESATWNAVIPKSDKDTLYALRRLSRWMDNVYVREPSGTGYWANVKVTFPQKHSDLTIPVTFNITRVEGGM